MMNYMSLTISYFIRVVLRSLLPPLNPTAPRDTTTDDGAEDESHWQDRVSSGFDRLVAFASTELDKTRRSIEDVGGPQPSRSASPDSGITQNVLSSTSSTSSTSQMESPMVVVHGNSHSHKATAIPMAKASPSEAAVSEKSSPPQTPSPAASPNLAAAMLRPGNGSPTLKIPLKYQRQSKVKHYKKKFRDRKWEYDDYGEADVFAGAPMSATGATHSHDMATHREPTHPHPPEEMARTAVQLKTSKFRPKGKDWGRTHHDGD